MTAQEQKQIESQIELLQNQLAKSKVKNLIFRDFGLNDSKKALLHKSFNVQIAKPVTKQASKKRVTFHAGLPKTLYRHCVAVEILAQHGLSNNSIAKIMKHHDYKYFDTEKKVTSKRKSWRKTQSGEKRPYIQTIVNSIARYGHEVEENLRDLGYIN